MKMHNDGDEGVGILEPARPNSLTNQTGRTLSINMLLKVLERADRSKFPQRLGEEFQVPLRTRVRQRYFIDAVIA